MSTATGNGANLAREKAEAIKAIANEFYSKKDFKNAYQKYTEAIDVDGSNAVYYSNRAAASLAMNQVIEACADATRAIKLDPKYAKAYENLEQQEQWVKAIELLPRGDIDQLSQAEKKQREQYGVELGKAQAGLHASGVRRHRVNHIAPTNDGTVGTEPWRRALQQEAQLKAEGNKSSSAWVILGAHRDFAQSMSLFNAMKSDQATGSYGTEIGAIMLFLNGIMRDSRIFSGDMGSNWLQKFKAQIAIETVFFKGWTGSGSLTTSLEAIQREAPQRLEKQGWDILREQGFLEHHWWGRPGRAALYYTYAVMLLHWVMTNWVDVPAPVKGTSFQFSYVLGVKRLNLEAMIMGLEKGPCPFTENDVAKEANSVFEILGYMGKLRGIFDPGFVLSFQHYPRAEAHVALGVLSIRKAAAATAPKDAQKHFMDAHKQFIEAANILPSDDEKTFRHLYSALEALWLADKPLKDQLPLLSRVAKAAEDMLRFWPLEESAGGSKDSRELSMDVTKTYTDCVINGLSSGLYTPESVLKPQLAKYKGRWSDGRVLYVDI
ncbi:hypothetical protein BJ165DRAFT_1400914 [Panaeolus papilionaceus]|nr:hypothetical protein BJ165DRAFT_1400914 [Panaeolus papilionaceus]